MDETERKINTGGRDVNDYMPASQSVSEKVTDTVGTFFNLEYMRVKTTQIEAEKVTNTVGTFLNEEQKWF